MNEKGYIKKLLEFHKINKCRTCDCLQDELKRLFKETKDTELKKLLESHIIIENTHPCLGCKPCKPALLIGEFLSDEKG